MFVCTGMAAICYSVRTITSGLCGTLQVSYDESFTFFLSCVYVCCRAPHTSWSRAAPKGPCGRVIRFQDLSVVPPAVAASVTKGTFPSEVFGQAQSSLFHFDHRVDFAAIISAWADAIALV